MFSCFKKETIYDKFYATAKAEMGVEEIPGSKDNPRIVEYHDTTTLSADDDETPWCSSFVCWVLQRCRVRHTYSAAARSYMQWGKPLSKPVRGCICVFTRDGGGHVGFYHSEDEKSVFILGGNQGNRVSIMAYSKSRLLGYRGVA